MEFPELINSRQSVRRYEDRAVEPAKMDIVLSTALRAPSAGNLQAFKIYVVRDEAAKRELAAAARGQGFVSKAPVVLVFCADLERGDKARQRFDLRYSVQDAVIAMAYAQLAATDQGLGSCWVGSFDDAQVARSLDLPRPQRPVAILPLGYTAETPESVERRPLSEMVIDAGT